MGMNTIAGSACRPLSRVPSEQRRVLIIEEDPHIAGLLRVNLLDEGFNVTQTDSGPAGLRHIEHSVYDLLVLDLMLPGFEGFEICRRVRARPDYTPIVIVSTKTDEAHRIFGFELGADDYLTKPFSILELVARIRSLFRRIDHIKIKHTPNSEPSFLRVGELDIDVAARDVRVSGRPVRLTPREFALLHFFARNPGRVFTRPELLNHVWGYGHDGYEHTVSHINRLRSKIEPDPSDPSHIVTVWGVGYKFGDPSAHSFAPRNRSFLQG
jgi:two-component system OmpR family response regulator